MKKSLRHTVAVSVGLLAASSLAATATAAPGEGNGRQTIEYSCSSGPLAGQTIDVSNAPNDAPGASGFLNGTVYLAESVTVTIPGVGIVYHHDYGQRNGAGEPSECTAQEGPASIDAIVAAVGQAA